MIRYLPVFVILSLLAEILGTVGGFGSSVFFVPIANFFMGFTEVLGLTALFHLASNMSKIAFFKKGLDKKLLLYLGIPAVLFVILGAFLSAHLDPLVLTLVLGGFLVLFSILQLLFPHKTIDPNKRNAFVGGSLSGFSAGILGTGGAIRGATMAAFNLRKEVFVATSAVIDMGVDASRTVVYLSNGYMTRQVWILFPVMIVIGIAGTYIGKLILKRMSQDHFRLLVLILVLIVGLVTLYGAFSS
jgi:uncharacterized membrane protein YfcA